jgi:CubicO group peptidase (beta-lactamase class C family)
MRRCLLALAIFSVALVDAPLGADLTTARLADDLIISRFTGYLEALRAQAGIPGIAASIVGQDDTLWEHAFGQENLEQSIATRSDTPFQLDGVTQLVTASLVLRCVEEGRFSLDDPVAKWDPDSPDANVTIRQLLSHTSGTPGNLVFTYNTDRLAPLADAVSSCTGDSFRTTVGSLLDRLAMVDSIPGSDIVSTQPGNGLTAATLQRYRAVMDRLAVPYTVDANNHASRSQYTATTLSAAAGLISTTRDLANFDLGLRKGILLKADTLNAAWTAPINHNGQALPHGLGWFVQNYNGEAVVWQFGVSENASSSLVVTVPGRQLTFILMANSDGLARWFPLTSGDVTVSPFVRAFLAFFVR